MDQPAATWRVSTVTRHLWVAMFTSGILTGGLVAYATNPETDPETGKPTSVLDAMMQPIPLVAIAIALAITFVVAYQLGAALEGGPGWIARTRPKPTRIAVDEVVRVRRSRGVVGRDTGAKLAKMSFTLETADGRKIHVAESGVYRKPSPLIQLFDQAMAVAVDHALRELRAGTPLVVGTPGTASHARLFADRIEYAKKIVRLADVGFVVVMIGTSATVEVWGARNQKLGTLPDDEMALRILAALGIRVETQRVAG